MRSFDSYLVVDWSASSVPKVGADSVWSALAGADGAVELHNHSTRRSLERWLHSIAGRCGRLLAGFDFSFGYPAGFASSLPGAGEPWERLWSVLAARVVDGDDNANNRFEIAAELNARTGPGPGPFWGCPPAVAGPTLSARKAPGFPHGELALAEFRRCELVMRASGHRLSSSWQLLGAGSVGSQTLMGVPVLERLRRARPDGVAVEVWPFTTGLRAPSGGADRRIVLAEVWPGWIPIDPTRHAVRDACQVLGLVEHLRVLDHAGRLAPLMEPTVEHDVRTVAETEEGWVLGAVT